MSSESGSSGSGGLQRTVAEVDAMMSSSLVLPLAPMMSDMWKASILSKKRLEVLAAEGIIPAMVFEWKANENQGFLSSNMRQLSMFESFFRCGFFLPTLKFLYAMLEHYKVELVHLNPNSILVLALFVRLCEAF